jgi:hypothetical protein
MLYSLINITEEKSKIPTKVYHAVKVLKKPTIWQSKPSTAKWLLLLLLTKHYKRDGN